MNVEQNQDNFNMGGGAKTAVQLKEEKDLAEAIAASYAGGPAGGEPDMEMDPELAAVLEASKNEM